MYEINWTRKASKQLLKIALADQGKIVDAVGSLKYPDAAVNITRLTNHQYEYRLRVGNYRVLFDRADVVCIVEIQEVKRRDDRTY